ncbi:MAG: hypothetical protein IE880_03470 [Epsilonproteobacteria bacterium]|nr:hypothetical protein [Campylobacterota bacterium]
MGINEIMEMLKSQYKSHDRLNEMIEDLSSGGYYDYWASNLCDEEFNQNFDLARELYKLYETTEDADLANLASKVASPDKLNDKAWAIELFKKALANNSDNADLLNIADSICDEDGLNDKDWASKIYTQYYENMDKEELYQYNSLINSLKNNLSDDDWANRIASEAFEQYENCDDVFEFAGDSSNLMDLAEYIHDEDKSKTIFQTLKTYEDVTELLNAARKAKELFDDENYVNDYCNDIIDLAIENAQAGYYCDIYNFIKEDLEDYDKAEEFKHNYEEDLRNEYDEYGSCEDLFGNGNNVDLEDIDFDDYEDRKVLVAISNLLSDLEDIEDDDEKIELGREKIEEFTETLSDKLQGNLDEVKLISPDPWADDKEVLDYENGLAKVNYESILFLQINKDVPLDVLNAIFLDMNDYGFYANILQENGDFLTQGYDFGEYNTGWFSNDHNDCYINANSGYLTDISRIAQEKLGL